jgi:hypothetical protein
MTDNQLTGGLRAGPSETPLTLDSNRTFIL